MEQEKFNFFCDSFEDAFRKVILQLSEVDVVSCQEVQVSSGKKLSSIVGVVGLNKGRIHVEMAEDLVHKLYEIANGEPAGDEMDLCFYLAEFTNMITGSGITVLNNTFKGSNLRLTPPAIFAGENIDITTPKVQSETRKYKTKYGAVLIEIGFEGV
jgi:chemotaxis protein CheX